VNRKAVVWLTLCLIWGSTWLFIKVGLEDLPPISFAGFRFLIAVVALIIIVRIRKLQLPSTRSEWLLLAGTGILTFGLNYGLLFWGEQRVSSGLAAVLHTIIPVFGLALAHYYLPNERMTWSKVSGVLLGIAGVVVIFSDQLHSKGSSSFVGSVALVVGAFCMAYANVMVKAKGHHMDPAVIAAGQMLCGLIPLLCCGWIFEGNPLTFHWTTQAVLCIAYLGLVGSCCAFLLYYWLLKHLAVTKSMLISLVAPVIAVLLGSWWLKEQVTWQIVVGALCIMLGITLSIYRDKRALDRAGLVEQLEFEQG
jgi:drug/metabolite transporter (DMT)-like permease